MRILIDILHPAHVHFFKGYIKKAQAEGHSLTIVTRDKEITNALLDRIGIPYRHLTTPADTWPGMVRELFFRWWKIYTLLRHHNIRLAMSISGLSTALPARIQGIPNITFTDTEDARLSNRISFPFSDIVATPKFFLHNLGGKHFRYQGLHELAYLKYFNMEGLSTKTRSLGLPDRYVIIRLVAKDALHDIGVKGIPISKLEKLIELGERMGHVYLNSQSELPNHLQEYRLPVPIEDIHIALAGALLFIGESPTMAVESSLLGTPAFLISSRWKQLGNMIHLEKDYHLLRNFTCFHDLETDITKIDSPLEMKEAWQERAARFRQNSVDIEEMIEQLVQLVLRKKKSGNGIS